MSANERNVAPYNPMDQLSLYEAYEYEAKQIRRRIYELHRIVKEMEERVLSQATEYSVAELRERIAVLEKESAHNDLP